MLTVRTPVVSVDIDPVVEIFDGEDELMAS